MTEYRKWPSEELARYLSRHEWPESRNALELGCGHGRNLWLLAEHDFCVTGVDNDEKALDEAEDYLCERHVFDAALRYVILPKLDKIADASMDLVVDCQTLQHLSDDDYLATLTEVYRILRTGGRFWSQFWVGRDQPEIYPAHPELRTRPPKDIRAVYDRSGLKIEQIEIITRTYQLQFYATWALIEGMKP